MDANCAAIANTIKLTIKESLIPKYLFKSTPNIAPTKAPIANKGKNIPPGTPDE